MGDKKEYALYPVEFNSACRCANGRRHPKKMCVRNPTAKETGTALRKLGYGFVEEKDKLHPKWTLAACIHAIKEPGQTLNFRGLDAIYRAQGGRFIVHAKESESRNKMVEEVAREIRITREGCIAIPEEGRSGRPVVENKLRLAPKRKSKKKQY
jgi:signal recognition particle subunit SEC65